MWCCPNRVISKEVPVECTLHWSCFETDSDFSGRCTGGVLDRYSASVLYLCLMSAGIDKGMNPTLSGCSNGKEIWSQYWLNTRMVCVNRNPIVAPEVSGLLLSV